MEGPMLTIAPLETQLERAVLHSFQKNKYTIVDPHSVGESFCVHVRHEREQFGRECRGQWSWIGGLTGPTNPTWHLEMRDFLLKPQYDYAMDDLAFYNVLVGGGALSHTTMASTGCGSIISTVDLLKVLILYGSETGTAESVAVQLKKSLSLLKPLLMKLDDAAGLDIVRKRHIGIVLCVCSTFGEGGPPSNAGVFLKTPIIRDVPLNTKFAVLALGSTLYPDFCKAGIQLDRMLSNACFQTLAGLVKADEVGGGEKVRKGWLDIVKLSVLPPQLEEHLRPPDDEELCIHNAMNWSPDEDVRNTKTVHGSVCLDNKKLTPTIKKITFEVPAGSSYSTGDHLVVYPVNPKEKIIELLSCFSDELTQSAMQLGIVEGQNEASFVKALEILVNRPFSIDTFEGEQPELADVFFDMPLTLEDLLTVQLDMAMHQENAQILVKLMNERLEELLGSLKEDEENLALLLNDSTVKDFIQMEKEMQGIKSGADNVIAQYPTLLNFLDHYRSVFLDRFSEKELGREGADSLLSLADVLVSSPRLQPRFYSISSSSNVSPGEVTITVGILKAKTSKGVDIKGVCSHYLASLSPGVDKARIGIRTSSFRLPEETEAPLIMIGAGTGLSPLMGFLQDRALDNQRGARIGSIHLFFGCRDESFFIYEEEIRNYEEMGLLKLHLAMSRSKSMTYVQDKLAVMGKEGAALLLQPNTHYYVCGDARMAKDCHEACVQLIRKHGCMSRVAVVQNLRKMLLDGQ